MVADCKASIIVLGESGVGKTSLLLRFTKGAFRSNHSITMIDCLRTEMTVMDKTVALQLWDTAGQDKYKAIVKQYFRNADGVLLVYDVTDVTTFHKLSKWLTDLRETNETAVVIIVGNKTDYENKTFVSVGLVERFAEAENMEFFQASAKSGDNVNRIFEILTTKILEAKNIIPLSTPSSKISSISNSSEHCTTQNGFTETDSSNTHSSMSPVSDRDRDIIKVDAEEKKSKKKKKCC